MGQVRFDYYNASRRGAGSAEQLQLDLAVLEAKRLDAQTQSLPIKYTLSLAREHPLAFTQLRTTGKCTFQSRTAPLQSAFPGTYAHRLIAMQPTLTRTASHAPLRGLLTNGSQSTTTRADGTTVSAPHPPDALPVSDFDIGSADAGLQGLPGATLMPFEGSGAEAFWTLEFPAAANAGGVGSLADVLLTMHVRARFSAPLYGAQLAGMAGDVNRMVMVSSARREAGELEKLRKTGGAATISWAVPVGGESGRKVNNVFSIVVGRGSELDGVKGTVVSVAPARSVEVVFKDGVAFSNSPPVTDGTSTVAPSPLNVFTGIDADQKLTLTIKKADNPGMDFSGIKDIVIGVDYSARI
jgi:hypothetical protein